MLRKLLLTSVSAFLDATRKPYSEIVAKILISFAFLVLFTRYSPKSDDLLDIVMFTAQLCTFLTLFYAMLLRIEFFEEEGVSPNVVGIGLLAIQLTPLIISVACCLYAFGKEHGSEGLHTAQRISRKLLTRLQPKTKTASTTDALGAKVAPPAVAVEVAAPPMAPVTTAGANNAAPTDAAESEVALAQKASRHRVRSTSASTKTLASPEGADPAKHSDFSTNSPDPVERRRRERRRRRRHSTKAMEMAGAEDLVEAPLEVPRRRRRRGSSGEPALAEAEAPQAPKV